jgi:mono/diheme cytochrome c family protein
MKSIAIASLSILFIASSAFAADAKMIAKGKLVFEQNCASCHGAGGAGDGPAAVALNPKPRNLVTEDYKAGSTAKEIFTTLTNGLKGTMMVSYKHLPEADRKATAEYLVSLRKAAKKDAKPATKK